MLRDGDLEMDLIARTVARGGDVIDLQPREFRLLEVLMRNKGRVLTRTMLLERVWSPTAYVLVKSGVQRKQL